MLESSRHGIARRLVKRRVSNLEVEGISVVYAFVVDLADVHTELKRVSAVNPREIVGNIVNRRYTLESMSFTVRLKHEPERDIVAVAVAAARECLASEAVTEIVHETIADGPGVTGGHSLRMAP